MGTVERPFSCMDGKHMIPLSNFSSDSSTAPTPTPMQASSSELFSAYSDKVRRAAQGKEPTILTDIYQENINISVWQRQLSAQFQQSVNDFLAQKSGLKISISVTPQNALANIQESLGRDSPPELSQDIAELVDMFCCLFDLKRTGLRLTTLDLSLIHI